MERAALSGPSERTIIPRVRDGDSGVGGLRGADDSYNEQMRLELEAAKKRIQDNMNESRKKQEMLFKFESDVSDLHRLISLKDADHLKQIHSNKILEESLQAKNLEV